MADLGPLLKALRSRRAHVRSTATAQLCVVFKPLVRAQAFHYRNTNILGADLDDLEQEAAVGLVEACNNFAAEARKKRWTDGAFPTYATWCVRNALSKYVETLGNPVRIPVWMVRRLPKMKRITVVLSHELLRVPTHEEIAARMKMPVHAIETMLAYDGGSLDWERVTGEAVGNDEHRKSWDRINRRKKA